MLQLHLPADKKAENRVLWVPTLRYPELRRLHFHGKILDDSTLEKWYSPDNCTCNVVERSLCRIFAIKCHGEIK